MGSAWPPGTGSGASRVGFARGRGAVAVCARWLDAFAEALVPRACLSCDALMGSAERGLVCRVCVSRLAELPAPRCERCGHPRLRPVCTWCELLPPYVRAVRSVAWVPDGVAGALVHRFKYDGWTALAEVMGARMARLQFPIDVREERSVLVPVPLASVRQRERGYNQSTLLARAIAPHWGIPVRELLIRSRATESQTRLTPGGRRNNVAGAFTVASPPAELVGRHVVLVDDVVTTAATLNACAAALHAGGARIITYVTFGRARAAGDAP